MCCFSRKDFSCRVSYSLCKADPLQMEFPEIKSLFWFCHGQPMWIFYTLFSALNVKITLCLTGGRSTAPSPMPSLIFMWVSWCNKPKLLLKYMSGECWKVNRAVNTGSRAVSLVDRPCKAIRLHYTLCHYTVLISFVCLAVIPAANAIRMNKKIPLGIHVAFATWKPLIVPRWGGSQALWILQGYANVFLLQMMAPEADASRTIPQSCF